MITQCFDPDFFLRFSRTRDFSREFPESESMDAPHRVGEDRDEEIISIISSCDRARIFEYDHEESDSLISEDIFLFRECYWDTFREEEFRECFEGSIFLGDDGDFLFGYSGRDELLYSICDISKFRELVLE